MRLLLLFISMILFFIPVAHAQTDSLVRFCDLKYQSDFEKQAIRKFVLHKQDTFNLFLSIDKNMTLQTAELYESKYNQVYAIIERKKIGSKRLSNKVSRVYSLVHNQFLKSYKEIVSFPDIFRSGAYNCVTASVLYALVFEHLKIPYKIQASLSHVYLVANPGKHSVVIETTNPGLEAIIFSGQFQEHYLEFLKRLKVMKNFDHDNLSLEELYAKGFKQVREAKFNNLIGFLYHNQGIVQFEKKHIRSAVSLFQKAYFFDPNQDTRISLYNSLVLLIQKMNFQKVSDIDYLVQLSRFDRKNVKNLPGLFGNILISHLRNPGGEAFCDSVYQRLMSMTFDKKMADEFSFTYNIQMSCHYQHSDKIEPYISRALAIKGNDQAAQVMITGYLERKLFNYYDTPNILLHRVQEMKLRLHSDAAKRVLRKYELIAYLKLATYAFARKKLTEGNKYLLEFEKNCRPPVKSKLLYTTIDRTYFAIAQYYSIIGDHTKAKDLIHRASKYIPTISHEYEAKINKELNLHNQ